MNSARKGTGMNLFGNQLKGFAKALVILAAALLLSCGMCGLSLGLGFDFMGTANTRWANFVASIALLSGAAIVFSVMSIVGVLIAWAIRSILRPSKDGVQELFDADRDSEDKDIR